MASYYLADNLFSWGFVVSFLIMSLIVWLGLHFVFKINDVRASLILTLLGLVFLPFVVSATEGYLALAVVLIIGALFVQYVFRGHWLSWGEAFVMFVIALFVTGWLTPLL